MNLSAVSGRNITVDYTVSGTATGTDYAFANGTITIIAGNTSGIVIIAGIVDDLLDETGKKVVSSRLSSGSGSGFVEIPVKKPLKWDAEHPNLYRLRLELTGPAGQVLHRRAQRIGFRTVELRPGERE